MSSLQDIEYLKSDYVDPRPEQLQRYPVIPLVFFRFLLNTVGRLFPDAFVKLTYHIFSTPRIRAKHKHIDELLKSVKTFDFQHGKRMLKGYEWGSGDRIVLLIHGWESRGTALKGFVPQLVAEGFRVVTFDGPAHGDSEGQRTNILNFGSAIQTLIEYLNGNVEAAITHSFGGASIVYMLANQGKDIRINKLALISASSSTKRIFENYMRLIKAPTIIQNRFFNFINSKIEIPLDTIDVSTSNTKINVEEALIVHDELDEVTPISEAKKIAANWNDTTLVITKGYGHFRLIKNPDVVNRVVQFIVD